MLQIRERLSQILVVAVIGMIGATFLGCTEAVDEGEVRGTVGANPGSPAIDREPLVVYDISGYGIGGPIHQHLTVYSDGMITLSALNAGGASAQFSETGVSAAAAAQLCQDLMVAGALELDDRKSDVADLPMVTVTVFNGSEANAVHNTFSFYAMGGADAYQDVVDILDAFIQEGFRQ